MHLNNPSGKLKPIELTDAFRTDVEIGGGGTCETTIEPSVRPINAQVVARIQWIQFNEFTAKMNFNQFWYILISVQNSIFRIARACSTTL